VEDLVAQRLVTDHSDGITPGFDVLDHVQILLAQHADDNLGVGKQVLILSIDHSALADQHRRVLLALPWI
jgi:hypothetical protein